MRAFGRCPAASWGIWTVVFLGVGRAVVLVCLGVLLFYAIVSFSRFIAEFGCVVVVVYCCVLLSLFIGLFYILLLYSADLFHCLVFAFYCCVYLFCCLVSLLPKFVM